MGRLDSKIALVTGVARGQGGAHAIRLAQEGATIVAVDHCADVETVPYPLATDEDLATTAKLVKESDSRCLVRPADVRDLAALPDVVAEAVAEFGGIDVVVANAGIIELGPVLGPARTAVAGRAGREPDRRLEDDHGGDPVDDQARPRRLHRADQLGRRSCGVPEPRPTTPRPSTGSTTEPMP